MVRSEPRESLGIHPLSYSHPNGAPSSTCLRLHMVSHPITVYGSELWVAITRTRLQPAVDLELLSIFFYLMVDDWNN